jgi:hypothetical protein
MCDSCSLNALSTLGECFAFTPVILEVFLLCVSFKALLPVLLDDCFVRVWLINEAFSSSMVITLCCHVVCFM